MYRILDQTFYICIIMHMITKMKLNINVSITIFGNTIIYNFRHSHYFLE
jgi:hypothetical protein